jgi:hypothetical protein
MVLSRTAFQSDHRNGEPAAIIALFQGSLVRLNAALETLAAGRSLLRAESDSDKVSGSPVLAHGSTTCSAVPVPVDSLLLARRSTTCSAVAVPVDSLRNPSSAVRR